MEEHMGTGAAQLETAAVEGKCRPAGAVKRHARPSVWTGAGSYVLGSPIARAVGPLRGFTP